jgi:hypothetical protein
MTTFLMSPPVRATLRWQAGATLGVAVVAGPLAEWMARFRRCSEGFHRACGIAFAGVVASRVRPPRGDAVTMFLAEGAKTRRSSCCCGW